MITPFYDVPQSSDTFNFQARADNFIGSQLPNFINEINAFAPPSGGDLTQIQADADAAALAAQQAATAASTAGLDWNKLTAFSSTTVSIAETNLSGTNRYFLTETGKNFKAGMPVILMPRGDYYGVAYAKVLSYNANTGDLNVEITFLPVLITTTYSSWRIEFHPPRVREIDSFVRVSTFNGYGSTNTFIRRFLTNDAVFYQDYIAYTDSPTLGASFTIKRAGLYSISYSDEFSVANAVIGITSNGLPTSSILSQSSNNILSAQTSSIAETPVFCSFAGYLNLNAVIRPHTSGASSAVNSNGALTHFSIVYAGTQ